ncbi:hypothetical protein CEW46_27685, partial [Bacillus cereus]
MTNWYKSGRKKVTQGSIISEFSKDQLLISASAVEGKIKSIIDDYENGIKNLKAKHAKFVNETKASYTVKGTATITRPHGSSQVYDVGKKTRVELDGIKVYLGDEIKVLSYPQLDLVGKVGIASITAGDLVIRTN